MRTALALLFVLISLSKGYDSNSHPCGQRETSAISGRIVSGTRARRGEWPWQVLIMLRAKPNYRCGGTLIADDWILTAAHCLVEDLNAYSIFLGVRDYTKASGHKQVHPQAFFCHPGFNHSMTESLEHDLCLIKLRNPVTFTKRIRPVCLPFEGEDLSPGDSTYVTGWGSTNGTGSPRKLRKAEILVIDKGHCQEWYSSDNRRLPKSHFCAGFEEGGTDTCRGDSGGPLVREEQLSHGKASVLRGVTSYGDEVCGKRQRPGIYVKVSDYLDWINETKTRMSPNVCKPIPSENECGGIMNRSGIIRSPTARHQLSYPGNAKCKWKIEAPPGFQLRFNFICYFLLSPPTEKKCLDKLSIINDETGKRKEFCGNTLPKPHHVRSNVSTVVFSTSQYDDYPGFILEVAFIKNQPLPNGGAKLTPTHCALVFLASMFIKQLR